MGEIRGFRPLYWHTIVMLLCLGWFSIWIYRSALTPIYGEIQAALGVSSDVAMGAVASMYFFPYTAAQIPSGMLVDKFGAKAILVPGFALFALAAFFIGAASSLEMVYAGSFAAGLATGVYYGGGFSLSGRTIPKSSRTFANAVITTGSSVGTTVGLIGASWLVKTMGLPWNILLYIIGGIVLVVTLCFMLAIKPENRPSTAAVPGAKSGETAEEDDSRATTLFSLRSIGSYLLFFANCYAFYMLVTWLPNFLETERGFHGVAVGMSAALVGIAGIPGALFFSHLADRFRAYRLWLIVALEVFGAVTLVLIVRAPTQGLLLLGLVLYGLSGKLALDPLLLSHVLETAPKKRMGVFLATFNFFAMCSSVVAPLATGLISDHFSSKVGGFYVSICLLLVSVVFFVFATRRQEA